MNPIELLSTVTNFYDQAFNKLMAVTFGVIAFIGVLVPIVVGWVQTRNLKSEKSALLSELRQEIASEREEIRKTIEASVRAEMSELRIETQARLKSLADEIERAAASADASTFHLQGVSRFQSGFFGMAAGDFAHSAYRYIDAKDEANAQKCISILVHDCLPKMSADDYKEYKVEKVCNRLLKELRACNENGRYTNSIADIEREMEVASKRSSSTISHENN